MSELRAMKPGMSESHPVLIAVRQDNGTVEQVRIGTAVRQGDGFRLQLGELTLGPAERSVPRATSYERSAPTERGGMSSRSSGELPTIFPPYGKSKGQPIAGASMQDLEFYAQGSKRSLNDPSKARFHDKERAMLAALEAEIQRQQGGGGMPYPDDEGPPPPGDEDAPF